MFRLATVLKLRERERDQAAQELDQARRAIQVIDQHKAEIESEIQAGEDARHGLLNGQVQIHRLLDIQRYQLILVGQLQHLSHQRTILEQEEERRKHNLMLKQQAVRALEKLKEHQDEEATRVNLARQQSRIDEWSTNREARSSQ